MANYRDQIKFYVNGAEHTVDDSDAFLPLSSYLRYQKGLIGTKVVCEEGDCGACTVLVGRLDNKGELRYQIIDACIQFIFQLDLCHVITVEGLSLNGRLHQVQDAMIKYFGSQCGFCTPGFVVAIADLVEKEETIDEPKIKQKLTGNLCRCTGYEPIIKACLSLNDETSERITDAYDNKKIAADLKKLQKESVRVEGVVASEKVVVLKPATIKDALLMKKEHPEAKPVSGATDIGVQVNKGVISPKTYLSLTHLNELSFIDKQNGGIKVGALASWSDVEAYTKEEIPELNKIISVFASEQIKNTATMAGNIANASPIADSLPFLYVANAELVLESAGGKRSVNINDFYQGYKKMDIKPEELITQVHVPSLSSNSVLKLYKVSKRKDLDISTFTAAILLEMKGDTIDSATLAYGGVGPVILRLPKTEKFLAGKKASEEIFNEAGELAAGEITPISDVRASKDYRFQLAKNIMVKFYYEAFATEEVTV